jgi:hypothetical protein
VQSIVGDEGLSYLVFVRPDWPAYWEPSANNHILNSLWMRGFVWAFGLHPLTVRAPALIGAAIYIASAYALVILISPDFKIRIPLFVCLVYNPFVADFFVAARGYGLADGFLLAAIAIAAWTFRDPRRVLIACAAASASIGLAFVANFSFAFAAAAVMLLIWIWALNLAPRQWRQISTASILPGLAIVVLLASHALTHWPKGQLYEGAESLRETFSTASEASLYRINEMLVNPLWIKILDALKNFLIPIALVLAAIRTVILTRHWHAIRERIQLRLGALCAAAVAISLAAHWIAFRAFGLLMPRHRTALFLVPLLTIAVGAAAAIPSGSRPAAWLRRALTATLVILAAYFVLCLRLTYFKEWAYIAEAKQAYYAAAYFNHTRCVNNVSASWYYDSALDFYLAYSGKESFTRFTNDHPHDPGHQLYVLHYFFDKNVFDTLHLRLVYRGEWTDIAIGVTPEVADSPPHACATDPGS